MATESAEEVASVEEDEKLDVVEVTDEIVRQSRYGQRNYRTSIGADHRRHWHGDFIAEEEEVEGDEKVVDPETFEKAKVPEPPTPEEDEDDVLAAAEKMMDGSPMDGAPEQPVDLEENEDGQEESEEEGGEEEEVKAEDQGNMADVTYGDFDDEAPEHTREEIDNFMDPLHSVEGLEDVVSDPDQTVEVNIDQDEEQPDADEDERTDTVS